MAVHLSRVSNGEDVCKPFWNTETVDMSRLALPMHDQLLAILCIYCRFAVTKLRNITQMVDERLPFLTNLSSTSTQMEKR